MAIKVIEKGKFDNTPITMTCWRCYCVYTLEVSDAKLTRTLAGLRMDVACPHCSTPNDAILKPVDETER